MLEKREFAVKMAGKFIWVWGAQTKQNWVLRKLV